MCAVFLSISPTSRSTISASKCSMMCISSNLPGRITASSIFSMLFALTMNNLTRRLISSRSARKDSEFERRSKSSTKTTSDASKNSADIRSLLFTSSKSFIDIRRENPPSASAMKRIMQVFPVPGSPSSRIDRFKSFSMNIFARPSISNASADSKSSIFSSA